VNEKGRAIGVGGNYKEIEECKGNVIVSSDNGKSWKMAKGGMKVAFKECVLQLEDSVWLATGPSGTTLSVDDGENWTEVDHRPFHTMDYNPGNRTGFMAGDKGSVVKFTWKGKNK
jgi:photosystem II stability/assembly factor-like uncharacterized protein